MPQRSSNPDGVERAGYIDVKFCAKKKGKRSWYRRWVVIVKLRVESGGPRSSWAKVDIYPDEDSWKKSKQADRTGYILENVKTVRRIPSSTHAYAFHIDGGEIQLSLAGQSETETQDWIRVLRAIFMPKMRRITGVIDSTRMFEVSVVDNPASTKMDLNGDYFMSIEADHVQLIPTIKHQKSCKWDLSIIRSFKLANVVDADKEKVLDIISGPSADQDESVFRFYCVRARTLLNMIWKRIKVLLEQRDGEATSPSIRPRAATDSTNGSEHTSRNGTPTRQSEYAAATLKPEELQKRLTDPHFRSPGYSILQRTYKRNFSMAELTSQRAEVQEEESVYNHIGELSDEECCSADESDDDYDRPDYMFRGSYEGVQRPVAPYQEEPPPVPPSPRSRIRLQKGRAVSQDSDDSRTSSRDSGIINSPVDARPSLMDEVQDHKSRGHHDSVDSAYSSTTRRGSNEPLPELEEQTTDKASVDLLKQCMDANFNAQESQIGLPLIQSKLQMMHLQTSFEDDPDTPPYEELSKLKCSYRKNLMSFLGADSNAVKEATLSRRGSNASVLSMTQLKRLPREHKMAEIRKMLTAMGKSDDEENIYEDMDKFLKRKDLKKIFGEDFDKRAAETSSPTGTLSKRPEAIDIQRSTSRDGEKPKRLRRKFQKIVGKLASPRGNKNVEHLYYSGTGSDSSEEDPQRRANQSLQNLKELSTLRQKGPFAGNADGTPPLPKPRTVSASLAVTGSSPKVRQRKRSKTHPNDFLRSGGDTLPNSSAAVDDNEPVYDVPTNNSLVEPTWSKNSDDGNDSDPDYDVPRIWTESAGMQNDVDRTSSFARRRDLITGDSGAEDATLPMSPFQPFMNDPFHMLQSQDSPPPSPSASMSTFRARIRSEPDVRSKNTNLGERAAMSLPSCREFNNISPPVSPRRVFRDAGHTSYERTTSFEINISSVARPLSIDGSEWCDNPMFQVGSFPSDEDFYSFDNAEFIQLSLEKEMGLSDIPESDRSRAGSLLAGRGDHSWKTSGEEDISSLLTNSLCTDSGLTNGYSSDENSDYVDMTGRKFRSETESSYVSMTGPFERKASDC